MHLSCFKLLKSIPGPSTLKKKYNDTFEHDYTTCLENKLF